MTLEEVIAKLDLPEGARVNRRIAKKLVMAHNPSHQRNSIQQGIERLQWVAVLKPGNCAIAPGVVPTVFLDKPVSETIPVEELSVVVVEARPVTRLSTLVKAIHDAIPYLVLVLATLKKQLYLSIAWKRPSMGQQGNMVLVAEPTEAPPVDLAGPTPLQMAMLDALAVGAHPTGDLSALYTQWNAALLAAKVATITGTFQLVQGSTSLVGREALLKEHGQLCSEVQRLAKKLKLATQLRHRIDVSNKLKQTEAQLARVIASLNASA